MVHSNLGWPVGMFRSLPGRHVCSQGEGWIPDVVLSHSGLGLWVGRGLGLPVGQEIGLLEWWFSDSAADYDFKPWTLGGTTAKLHALNFDSETSPWLMSCLRPMS